jgi:hypothetical protein
MCFISVAAASTRDDDEFVIHSLHLQVVHLFLLLEYYMDS